MKTLHLNLHRKWFDMIRSGEKPEEYRKISEYWEKRLFDKEINPHSKIKFLTPKKFDSVTFSNGYSKCRDQFCIELIDIEVGEGLEKWGAVPDNEYFILKLGDLKEVCDMYTGLK